MGNVITPTSSECAERKYKNRLRLLAKVYGKDASQWPRWVKRSNENAEAHIHGLKRSESRKEMTR